MARCKDCNKFVTVDLVICPNCGNADPNRDENAVGGNITENKTTTLDQIDAVDVERIWTGVEWDNAWSGFVPSTLSIVSAPPGVGKTTILLQIASRLAALSNKRVYYLSAEQSPGEIRLTVNRLGLDAKLFRVLTAMGGGVEIDPVLLKKDPPACFVVDSVTGLCGRDLHAALVVIKSFKKMAVKHNVPAFIICHVNKGMDIAGAMGLQHECDITMTFDRIDKKTEKDLIEAGYDEKDLAGDVRYLCAWKNRFGPENVNVPLLMTEHGLVALLKKESDDESITISKDASPPNTTPPPPSEEAVEIGKSIHPTSQDEIEIKGGILPKRKKRQPKPARAEAIERSATKRGRPEMMRTREGQKAARQRRKEARA